jgi:hypothetical protein
MHSQTTVAAHTPRMVLCACVSCKAAHACSRQCTNACQMQDNEPLYTLQSCVRPSSVIVAVAVQQVQCTDR